jgi:phage baseplate assembly protein V
MTIGHLQNHMRLQAQILGEQYAKPRLGLISAYDPNTYAAKVRIQPDDVETGWLPVLTPWVGAGWGLHAPPTPGDQVLVVFQEGSVENGVVVGARYNNVERPLPAPSGELWLVHQSGAFVKLTTDGKLTLNDQAGSSVVLNGDGTGTMSFSGGLTLNANTIVNGDLHATGTVTGDADVVFAGKSALTHTHGGVQGGTANTQKPN